MHKRDFPALRDSNVVYVDNAATVHKPNNVIDAITQFYRYDYAPIHRGAYASAERATYNYENVRAHVAAFIEARHAHEIVFTKGATEGVNMVAWSWAWYALSADDEIVITDLEHHSHIVTWQRFADMKGCRLRRIPVRHDGELDTQHLDEIITQRTALVAVSAQSNVIGVPTDMAPIVHRARACGARVLCDASQHAPRASLAVREMQYDFCVFSAHKMGGPTGLGVLYIAQEHHDEMVPYLYGGGMVYKVGQEEHVWRDMPYRCEGGSPPSAQVMGLGATIEYLQNISFAQLRSHEAALTRELMARVADMPGMHIVGPHERMQASGHIISMYHEQLDPQDMAMHLDTWDICARSGHHCAQPLHEALGVKKTLRISFYGYNSHDDVERITLALNQLLS